MRGDGRELVAPLLFDRSEVSRFANRDLEFLRTMREK
jgi:hypothetical protein